MLVDDIATENVVQLGTQLVARAAWRELGLDEILRDARLNNTQSAIGMAFDERGLPLAYHLLTSVREKLRERGDLRDWKTLRRLLCTHSLATKRLPPEDGRVLRIRKTTLPDAEQELVYRKLGIESKTEFPVRKNFVKS